MGERGAWQLSACWAQALGQGGYLGWGPVAIFPVLSLDLQVLWPGTETQYIYLLGNFQMDPSASALASASPSILQHCSGLQLVPQPLPASTQQLEG